MPYREPAPDEEKQLDAEEIAAFQRVVEREKRWLGRLVILGAVASMWALAGLAYLFARSWNRTDAAHRSECHWIASMHDDGTGNGQLVREDLFVCPDGGAE